MHRIWVIALLTTFGALAWGSPTYAQDAAEELETMRAELGEPPQPPEEETPEALEKHQAELQAWENRRDEMYAEFIEKHEGTDAARELQLEMMRIELGVPPRLTSRAPDVIQQYQADMQAWQERRHQLYAEFLEKHEGSDAARELKTELAVEKMRGSGGEEPIMREAVSELAEIAEAAKDPKLKAEALYFKASALVQLEDWAEAITAYEKAAKISPDENLAEYANKGAYSAKIHRDGLLDVGKKPIDFAVTALDGETTISPDMYEGKVVLIDFWATWCGPCIRELPVVKQTYEQFHGKGFEIIGISLDREGAKEKLKSFIEENEMPWVQHFDGQYWSNEVAQLYAINSIPATFLLDQEGKIAAKDLRGEALPAKVAELLGEEYEPKGEGGEEQPSMGTRPVVGDVLPAFEAKTLEGDTVSPKSLKGQIVLVDFWATWCGPCVAELPHVKKAYEEFRDDGFTVVGISLDKPQNISAEKVSSFAEKRELGWPMIYDSGREIAMQYGIQAIPATFLVDRSGKIRATDLRGDALSEKVAELIAEQQ